MSETELQRAQRFERDNQALRDDIIHALRDAGWDREDATAEADNRLAKLFEEQEHSNG